MVYTFCFNPGAVAVALMMLITPHTRLRGEGRALAGIAPFQSLNLSCVCQGGRPTAPVDAHEPIRGSKPAPTSTDTAMCRSVLDFVWQQLRARGCHRHTDVACSVVMQHIATATCQLHVLDQAHTNKHRPLHRFCRLPILCLRFPRLWRFPFRCASRKWPYRTRNCVYRKPSMQPSSLESKTAGHITVCVHRPHSDVRVCDTV